MAIQKELSKINFKQKKLIQTYNPCATAPLGTQEQVFCQVQKFEKIHL